VSDNPPSRAAPARALASWRAWALLLLVVAAGLAADLVSKHLAFEHVADHPVNVNRAAVLRMMADDPRKLVLLVPPHEPVVVAPHLLEFKLVLNSGAVFGAGQGRRHFFIGFTVVALLFALVMFAFWTTPRDRISHAAIGLVLAGGIGNLYDRLVFACVRDFIHPLPGVKLPFGITWPSGDPHLWPYVSNVADAFLLVGIALLVIRLWNAEEPNPGRPTPPPDEPGPPDQPHTPKTA